MGSESVEIEGLEFDYILQSGEVIRAKVSVYEPGVGLTIQAVEGGLYLLCVHGPLSPKWDSASPETEEVVAILVMKVLEAIANTGKLYSSDILGWREEAVGGRYSGSPPSKERCAFSQ